MERCFAEKDERNCTALKDKKCEKCKFFRTDITREKIEKDIKKYTYYDSKTSGKKEGKRYRVTR